MRKRGEALELTILGLLANGPVHGYEMRKRIISVLGPYRAIAFSVLYPQLHRLLEEGKIEEKLDSKTRSRSARKKIVYNITPQGRKWFTELTGKSLEEQLDDDETFEARIAFFGHTPKTIRLRILEGRIRRMNEKAKLLREDIELNAKYKDKYATEWRRHTLEITEQEISWLEKMATMERKNK